MAFLVSCSNKQLVKKAPLNNEVTWQYSDYLNGAHFSNQKELNKNDFFISNVGGSSTFPIIAYPIIGKDYIVVMDKAGSIMRVSSSNKKIEWTYNAVGHKFKLFANYLNGGLSQNGDKIYATYGANFVDCIDSRTGQLLWNKKLQEMTRAYPIVSNGVVFIQTLSNGMYALNAENGGVLWYKAGLTEDVSVVNVTSPVLYKNSLITQNSSGRLAAINNKVGFEDWSIDNSDSMVLDINLDGDAALIYQPINVDDDLYFYTSNGHFYKLNLTNKTMSWKSKFNVNRPFYISDNIIFAVDDTDSIVAINTSNGLELWKSKLVDFLNAKERKKSRYWNAPIVANKNVYILSSNGELLSFDINGKFIKVDYKMGMGSYLPPIYAGEKAVIISSK